MKRIVAILAFAGLLLAAMMISPAATASKEGTDTKKKLLQRIEERIFLILGIIAIVTGIILELRGYGAMIEGLIIGFGFFLIHVNEKTRDEIRSSADRIIEVIAKTREK